jgi:hypothetical protein
VLLGYVFAMIATDTNPQQSNDTAAGTGIVIFAVPVLLVLTLLLAIGFAIGWTLHRASPRTRILGAPQSGRS